MNEIKVDENSMNINTIDEKIDSSRENALIGTVKAVCISEKKGTPKTNVGSCKLIKDFGLENDAHAGSGRQVSLLSWDKVEEFRKNFPGVNVNDGDFGENFLIEGFDFRTYPIGTRFEIVNGMDSSVELELTQIGKSCHSGCTISRKTGKCIMPQEGVFARVVRGGKVKTGDKVKILPGRRFTAAVLVASDRSFRGERKDESGPAIQEILEKSGYLVLPVKVLPDDEDGLYEELVRITDIQKPDVIFTSGGTGFSPRDMMPEATLRAAHKNASGIAEALRAYSLSITPRAMLSRAISVIRNRTLIINMPGSPKAGRECTEYLLPVLEHGIPILRGEGDA